MEEGVAREESEKEVAKGFIRPSLAFGPCSVKHPGDFKVGSGMAEATVLFAFPRLPQPVAGKSKFSA